MEADWMKLCTKTSDAGNEGEAAPQPAEGKKHLDSQKAAADRLPAAAHISRLPQLGHITLLLCVYCRHTGTPPVCPGYITAPVHPRTANLG